MLAASASLLRRCAVSGLRAAVRRPAGPAAVLPARCYSHGSQESDEEFDARWVTYFNKPDIDAWELRKGINTLVGYDLVPEPKIIDAALRACRRLNDFASAVRILEVVKLIWAEKKRLNKGTDVVEKRGPYIMSKPPSIQAKLKRQRELAKAALRRQGLLGAPTAPKPPPKRTVKFNKGYTALSQTADENLVSLDSDRAPLCPPQQVTQDMSRQLLQDGYHLDEVPDDEDLDLIPPKPAASSSCPCCFGENLSCVLQ
ncbi:hypothetical protein DUI87_29372 [Hirundo rustica rustica]|uniref:Cytochrome c oxidase subunit 5A, mitochondrial n=1 Tax=Hirundo rustica rustica TaxID=333673 RepID=A0A3M0J2L2_HIRRU|nr:hypothetical protein DUI87_29372 [Hirundo rustica rustica]